MKVAFWNTVPMAGSISGYVAAIGTMLCLEYRYEVILGSNYFSNHMLQDCFLGKMKEEGIARAPYNFFYGSKEYDATLWNFKKKIQRDILEIPMEGMKVIFPPETSENHMFYYKAPPSVFYLLEFACDNNDLFRRILNEAELIVVFLPQNVAEIQNFFRRFSSIIPKAFFVIIEVERSNRSFYKNCVAKYGVFSKNIGSVSVEKTYEEACVEGKIVSFLQKKYATKYPQYKFVSSIKTIVRRLNEYHMNQEKRSEE